MKPSTIMQGFRRLLNALDQDSNVNMSQVLDTPDLENDMISVCDRLRESLQKAERSAAVLSQMLYKIKNQFGKEFTLPPVF